MDGDEHGAHDDALDELIHRADLDGLVRLIDARCASRDWDGLRRLRDRARVAVGTGRQLWPAATLAEYRLALLAPAPWAAAVVDDDAGRFTIGPLTEVVAQHHTWAELRPHLGRHAATRYVAHERVLRGDAIDPADLDGVPAVIDLPLDLRAWEPSYVLPTYGDDGVEVPSPALPGATSGPAGTGGTDAAGGLVTGRVELEPTAGATRLDDPDTELAVRDLVDTWTAASTGHAEVVCVDGGVAEALGALGVRRAGVVELDAASAIGWLAWAGASGGAHGRRRGAAAGRFGAWWVLGALGDLHDEWPPDDDQVTDLLGDLRWWRWDAGEPETGWQLRLAIVDVAEGIAWAINASDAG